MSIFNYTPLSVEDNSIRLLVLKPGTYDCEIEIELFHVSLGQNESPAYEALSYVWGTTENRQNIVVRERLPPDPSNPLSESVYGDLISEGQLPVTQNLEIALRHLRRSTSHRVLWIDAICIDQQNTDERNYQVRRMGEVYQTARQVLVWLGPSDKTSPLAVQTLHTIGTDYLYDNVTHTAYSVRGSMTESLENDAIALKAKNAEWLAVRDLFEREWFTRLWVYQEIRLSKQATLLVGSLQLDWQKFTSAVWWILGYPAYQNSGLQIFDSKLMDAICGIVAGYHPTQSVEDILEQTRHRRCCDPRDRVYAILGVIQVTTHQRFSIIPDYTKSVEEVYLEFARDFVLNGNGLTLLRFVSSSKATGKLPTWVPDLSDINACGQINAAGAAGSVIGANLKSTSVKDGNLNLTGLLVDKLLHCESPLSISAQVSEIHSSIQSWEPHKPLTAPYVGGGTLEDAFVKTIFCGRVLEDCIRGHFEAPTLEYAKTAYKSGTWRTINDEPNRVFTQRLLQSVLGRKFCRTANGLIGMFPADAQVGDQVWVTLGSGHPLLLRQVEDSISKYQLLGYCYVAGIMHGESVLGQLPRGWARLPMDKNANWAYVHEDGTRTSQDPRLGTLPDGWTIEFSGGREMNPEGEPNNFWFEHAEHDSQWYDPRLSKENLLKRGVILRDITIV
ncbi:hypothetical protein GLAREA_08610 [Glarea lozoyensis ATCC 20868]|uniref:WW domain-containing protein n=1 Tax=Glarea lozoyensis (strain ATCC 20868 / MF5171) TaxID=1116229 RepID=S3CE41_GLAL2|nr:uncharacterized protein GLAREA_08610 [Glarea lozoyensis ATCC 20868]EPE24757.1 hypothetical protein GLAREA_08610 [Glarea lozoyensis ATCC 20868]